jgi:hypothetical protein
MFGRLWSYIKKQVIADVPNEIAACLDCDVPDCPGAKLMSCRVRLARAAALEARDATHGLHIGSADASGGTA